MNGVFWGLLCLLLCAPGWARAPRLLGRAALVYALYESLTLMPFWWPTLWFGLHYNWLGKLLGVLLGSLVIYGFKWVSPREVGLNRPLPGSLRWAVPVVLGVAALKCTLAFAARHHNAPPGPEDWLYQLTMPGIAEELMLRGVLLGLLGQAFPRNLPFLGTRTSWGGVVGVVLFVLAHGFSFPDGPLEFLPHAHFSLDQVTDKLFMGSLFLWVRERTGSCYAAMATHNLMNTCLTVGHALLR